MTVIKKLAASLVAVFTLGALASTASASYIDGDREVDYYEFKIDPAHYYDDTWPDCTVGIKKRIADRNWVVSVNSVSSSKYAITYSVMRFEDPYNPNNKDGATEIIANDAVLRGTGNSGGKYLGNYKGSEIHMCALKPANLPYDTILRTSGQWSPDAPY